MATSKTTKQGNKPFGVDFYSRIATALLSKDPKSFEELKEMADMVQKSKLKSSDELWDSGDDFSVEAEGVFKAANRLKKIKPVDKEKKTDEKADKEKSNSSADVEMEEE